MIKFNTIKRFFAGAKKLFWGSAWLLGLSLLVWYPLRWYPGDRLLPIRFLNYFSPWILLGMLPPLAAAWYTKRRPLMVILALPALGIGLNLGPFFLPQPPLVTATNQQLKVMSHNILHRNRSPEEVIKLLHAERPDIIMLQEVTIPLADQIAASLGGLYPDSAAYMSYEPAIAQAIISRYPITDTHSRYQLGRAQTARLQTPANGEITVINIHPRTAIGNGSWQEQRAQFLNLAEKIRTTDGPLIVGGDFNTTPQSDNYWLIAHHLTDAHRSGGQGLAFTYPADGRHLRWKMLNLHWDLGRQWPLISPYRLPILRRLNFFDTMNISLVRIDHIFVSDHFAVHRASTLANAAGSDHRPTVAELVYLPSSTR